jgi:hypothetical protein
MLDTWSLVEQERVASADHAADEVARCRRKPNAVSLFPTRDRQHGMLSSASGSDGALAPTWRSRKLTMLLRRADLSVVAPTASTILNASSAALLFPITQRAHKRMASTIARACTQAFCALAP